MSSDVYQATKKRLAAYSLFSDKTIEHVARFAGEQFHYEKYQDFLNAANVPEVQLFSSQKNGDVPYVDIPAKTKKPAGTIVIHLPMGNPLDPNQLYQVGTIAAVNNKYRVIAFGNPSGKSYKHPRQSLSFSKRFKIAFTNNRSDLVAAELEYLELQKLSSVHHVGYSYGALKALIATQYSTQPVVSYTALDPVAHTRGLRRLVRDFKASFPALDVYVNRTQIPSFLDARRAAGSTGHYNSGLARTISIAIGLMLARTDFIQLLKSVLEQKPLLFTTVAWGAKSELGDDAYMTSSVDALKSEYPKVNSMRLTDDKHAFANDIHLHAALVFEVLASVKSK